MKEAKVKYPCWWTYALIGPDEEEIRLAIGAVTRGLDHKVQFSKQSKEKRYVSLHVEVWVVSQEQRDNIFQAFKTDSRIRMVL
jgi:putative lipoic acid-binding regulatory protein